MVGRPRLERGTIALKETYFVFMFLIIKLKLVSV